MTNKKSNLITRLGTAILAGATGLVGLVGCEAPQGNRAVSPYSQPQPYKQQSSDDYLGLRVLGAVGGAVLGTSSVPLAKDVGGKMFSLATTPGSNTNVTVNSCAQPSQPQVVLTPEQQALINKLLPEYNLEQLGKEYITSPSNGIGINSVFVSDNALDLNGDGIITIDEFNGVRRNRGKTEPTQVNTCITTHNSGIFSGKPRDYTVSVSVFDQNDNQVFRQDYTGTEKKFTGSSVIETKLPANLNVGIYKVHSEYKDNKNTSTKETVFQILEEF